MNGMHRFGNLYVDGRMARDRNKMKMEECAKERLEVVVLEKEDVERNVLARLLSALELIDLDDYLYNPQLGGDLGTSYNDMAYRANDSTYPPPGPSNVNLQPSEWNQSTSLQPLEVNVSSSELGDNSKLEVGRRRHRTDPTTVNRQMPENNSAPPSHVNSSGSLGMEVNNDFTSSICFKNVECSTVAGSSSVKVHRKSKGKPENVCQILSQMEKKLSSDSDLSGTSKPSIKVEDCFPNDADQNILVGDDAERFRRRSVAAKYPSQLSSVRISDRGGRDSVETAYRPAPILIPNRAGRGLYCNMKLKTDTSAADEAGPSTSKISSESDGLGVGAINDSPLPLNEILSSKYEDDDCPRSKRFHAECEKKISLDEHLKKPLRKKGFSFSPGSFPDFKAELQRAFEETNCSPKSTSQLSNYERSIIDLEGRVAAVDKIEMRSSDEKTSECVESIYTSDAVPKINRGERYQASVNDWVDREITDEELAEIPDRDEKVFDCNLIAHLDPEAIAAFEMLACSEAVPIPGRNKELALHLLMANKGNLTEAVADLMKVDMLNWEHTPVVYHSIYNDSVFWTPSEIALFQEAIYKSEKDFTEVAKKVRKTVKQCVEFFYLWKKAFSDDYKKLSNLVRKRRLLTQQGYHLRSAAHKDRLQKEESESESDRSSVIIDEKEQRIVDESCSMQQYVRRLGSKSVQDDQRMLSGTQQTDSFDMGPLTSGEASTSAAHEATNLSSPLSSRLSATVHRGAIKKGAQPASDGYFHCRLCDKYFEKVKSLNAHMKSHAMKARAEAEAQAQMNFQYSSPGTGNPGMRDKLVSTNVNIANVSNASAQLGQNQLSAVARAANALSQTASFNAVNALNQAALAQAQDLFVSTSLSQDPLVQSTLLQSPLSQASLAAQSALGSSALGQVSQNAIGQAAATQAAALGQAAQSVLGQAAATQGALNPTAQGALAPSTLSSVLGQGLQMPSAALQLFNSLHPTISHSSV